MIQIHPITSEMIAPYIGRSVLVVMNDGSENEGVLSGLRGGKLLLNDPTGGRGKKRGKTKTRKAKTKAKAKSKRSGLTNASTVRPDAVPDFSAVDYELPEIPTASVGPAASFDVKSISMLLLLV